MFTPWLVRAGFPATPTQLSYYHLKLKESLSRVTTNEALRKKELLPNRVLFLKLATPNQGCGCSCTICTTSSPFKTISLNGHPWGGVPWGFSVIF